MTFTDEVASGDERRALIALRDVLAGQLVAAESNVVAQIAGRLQAVIARIAELGEPTVKESASDEIARRREARRAEAQVAQAPAGQGVKRGKRSS
jgi:hypothetical protein